MTDLREGRIQAFLDLEMMPEGRRQLIAEMAADPSLAAAVGSQRDRIAAVSIAIDQGFPVEAGPDQQAEQTARAWTAVASRLGIEGLDLDTVIVGDRVARLRHVDRRPEANGSDVGRRAFVRPAIKAAGLVLVAVGAAAATIPGSPIREWVEDRFGTAGTPPAVTVETLVPATGVRLAVSPDPLSVVLPEPLSAETLSVSVVDGDLVEVLAGPGTRFQTSRGRIEVTDVQGPVTIRVPRAQAVASVEVGGRVFVRKSGERVEVLQEADSLPSEFLFRPISREPPQ